MTESKPKKLILLDGNALVHRAYHALPPLTTKKGESAGAVYGFAMTLLSVLEKFKPDYIAASFDLAAPTFRHEQYEDYKATRVKAPDDLYEQIPRVKELVTAFNIPIYEQEGFEADDCVGTIARQAEAQEIETIIVTGDNDALQLVSPLVKVFSIRKGLKDLVLYDRDAVIEKYGFPPESIPDYKGLAGDASDNIPGVAGIGAKTATDLLKEYGTLERIYDHLADIKESVRKRLESGRTDAFFSKDLGTIRTDVPVSFEAEKCVAHDYDRAKVAQFFQEMEFWSLLKRVNEQGAGNEERGTGEKKQGTRNKKQQTLKEKSETEKFLDAIGGEAAVWIHSGEASLFGEGGIGRVEVTLQKGWIAASKTPRNDNGKEIVTATIEWNEETKPALKKFFENAERKKIFYDAKTAIHMLKREKIGLQGIAFDAMIAAYLLQAGTRVEFDHLVIAELGEEMLARKSEALMELSVKLSLDLEALSSEQSGDWNISRVFHEVEMPLVPILAEMEENGIILNVGKFRKLSDELSDELRGIERKIYDFAGREFNINSPKQLAEVLFEDLKIPTAGIKKTKTGISTASTELEKLSEYPIVSLVEEERELFKLKTTYLDAFPELVDAGSRIHTTYQQAVTATGRLSSTEPNLQNIPSREKWSEAIRSAFEAAPGKLLVGADYSQIELRVMAHLSGDESLISAFERGIDVHRATASAVYSVAPEEVTPDQRREAKVFNFGLMYGMSAFGLAQSLGIDQKKAADFIRMYFEKFPGVATYMDTMKSSAKARGFVETELGRRRYVPEIQGSNPILVRSGERMAINMPVQGLAADIMKLSMLRAQMLVTRYAGKVSMLLQVHDELIFEVEEEIAQGFAGELKKEMEAAYGLRVPLIVETAIGKNWGEI